jgi:phenylalanine-4-hydroxylase
MRTKYIISDFQQTYFVIESFDQLLRDCDQDFGPLYEGLRTTPDLEAQELAPEDRVLTKGDFHYFRAKERQRTLV